MSRNRRQIDLSTIRLFARSGTRNRTVVTVHFAFAYAIISHVHQIGWSHSDFNVPLTFCYYSFLLLRLFRKLKKLKSLYSEKKTVVTIIHI